MNARSLVCLLALVACRSPEPAPGGGPLTTALKPGQDLRSLRASRLAKTDPRHGFVTTDATDDRTVDELLEPYDLRDGARSPELRRPGLYLVNPNDAAAGPLTDTEFDGARRMFAAFGDVRVPDEAGADRAAALWVAYRALEQGVDLETAVEEGRTRGLVSAEHEASVRAYVEARRRP